MSSAPGSRARPRGFLRAAVLALAALLATPPASDAGFAGPASGPATLRDVQDARTVAIGDVHGDPDQLQRVLRHAGLVDDRLAWSGGAAQLVLTGDLIDRGPGSREVLDLVMRLQREAPRQVRVLLGNHEVMNLMGDLRYVPEAEYRSYATPRSEALREARYESYVEFLRERARRLGLEEPAGDAATRTTWMAARPAGFFERRQAFARDGVYGRWLRGLDAALLDGEVVFVHGGLSPARPFASVEVLNDQVRREIASFDDAWRTLSEKGVLWPELTWSEALRLVREELDLWEAVDSLPAGRVNPAALEHRPDEATLRRMRDLLAYESWALAAGDGPLWYRGLAAAPEDSLAPELERLLAGYGARHVVVGHTPTQDSRVHVRFGGAVFAIDTGMSVAFGGRASALEIRGARFTALYPGEQPVVLWGAPKGVARGEDAGLAGGVKPESRAGTAPGQQAYDALRGLGLERIEGFMRTASIAEIRKLVTGITKPSRATLDDGELRHDVAIQSHDECEEMKRPDGARERACDSYRYNVAAYELGKLLGGLAIPPCVERKFKGRRAAFTWWIDDAMTFAEMKALGLNPPEGRSWNRQQFTIGLFDELIYNTDRNQGNLLVDPGWRIWMIDHTRAFRTTRRLRNPVLLARMRMESPFFAALQALTAESLERCCGAYLTSEERRGVLARRDSIVARFRPQLEPAR